MSTQRWNSAPTRSSLLTKQMRGTPYLVACRHTCSDCGSTPATPSNTATAPSSTRSDRSTSTVKSTWPGVSMMLIWWSFQKQVVAAEVMVMPRSCSWTIQSMVAAPSCTSPILRTRSSGWFLFELIVSSRSTCTRPSCEARSSRGARPGGRNPPGWSGGLPAVVRVGLVGLGHLVHVFLALHRAANAVVGVEELAGQPLGHRALTALAGVPDDPADRERVGAPGAHLDRHLVRGTTDAAALNLELRLHVVDRALQRRQGVAVGLLANDVERVVDDGLGGRLLATLQDLVGDLRDEHRPVDGVGHQLTARRGAPARHGISLPSWRRSGYGPACGRGHRRCRGGRG